MDCWGSRRKYPDYRHIGGVRVNCHSRHSVIDVTVALYYYYYYYYYYYGSPWVQWGNGTRVVRYNMVGSGPRLAGIVYTPASCVYGYRAYSWMVGATVRTERAGWTNYSPPAIETVGGCGSDIASWRVRCPRGSTTPRGCRIRLPCPRDRRP